MTTETPYDPTQEQQDITDPGETPTPEDEPSEEANGDAADDTGTTTEGTEAGDAATETDDQ